MIRTMITDKLINNKAFNYLEANHSPSEVSECQAAMNIAVWKAYIAAYKQALEDISVTEQSISDAADSYVGHPKEIGEDLTAYIKREAFKDGAKYILNKK